MITTLTLGGRKWICACLPAGLENADFVDKTYLQLQAKVGPNGYVLIGFDVSPAIYRTSVDLSPRQKLYLTLRLHLLRLNTYF